MQSSDAQEIQPLEDASLMQAGHIFAGSDTSAARGLMICGIRAGECRPSTCPLSSSTKSDQQPKRAFVDRSGFVLSSDEGFHELIAGQWPRHKSPKLPRELMQVLLDSRDHKFLGKRILADATLHGKAVLVTARCDPKLAILTPAQCRVLMQIASGYSNKEAAERLRLSLATIRNHLTTAYEKLEATGMLPTAGRSNWKKAALIRWWIDQKP